MTQLFLSPVDVWLFRDGRPFDPGSGRRAESTFPPYPTVIQGAIRSKHLTLNNIPLSNPAQIIQTVGTSIASGAPIDYKGLLLRGPFLAEYDGQSLTRYYPQPADAISVKGILPENKCQHTICPATPPTEKLQTAKTSLPEEMYLMGLNDPLKKGESNLWLSEAELCKYLQGNQAIGTRSKCLFQRENRIGIGMNDARQTVEDGFLYEVEFVRLHKNVGLSVEMRGYTGWPPEGLLQLGGESRAASYRTVQAKAWPELPDPFPEFFKVYFATPAYFDGGWQPKNWKDFFDGDVILRAAALNRYESLGGFDWAANPQDARAHRPARRYVPAGSVYYFQRQGKAKIKTGLVQNALTHFGAEIGFGQIIIPDFNWN